MIMISAVHLLTGMRFKSLFLLLESSEHTSGLKGQRRTNESNLHQTIVPQWHD